MTRARELSELGTVYDSGSSLGFRNRIINGDMRIDQRNAGASITSIGTGSQPVDRWRPFAASPPAAANVVAQRVNDAPTGFTNSVRFTVGTGTSSGATNGLALGQPIEGFNISDLGWGTATAQPVTLSFWIKSSITGTYSAAIQNYAETVSYVAAYTVSAANTWEYKTVNIPGPTTGTWPTDNNGAVRVSGHRSWQSLKRYTHVRQRGDKYEGWKNNPGAPVKEAGAVTA